MIDPLCIQYLVSHILCVLKFKADTWHLSCSDVALYKYILSLKDLPMPMVWHL